ncbi:SDR family oxidoreductase [Nocardia tengchongensis]|uniref:SDR family oxidoreductase n=1 Tax=Nocardia tengchongensis TaxID=2055889 RepID=UPI0033CD01B8
MSDIRSVPIAIVGMAAVMPGAADLAQYWRNIVEGRDLITDVPDTHWPIEDYYDPDPAAPDKTYCKRGGFLPDIDFDPIAHGMPPAAMAATDPAQLLGLVVADRLLTDVRRNLAAPLDTERVGVILGSAVLSMVGTMDARSQQPAWMAALRESSLSEAEAQRVCDRISARFVQWQEASLPGLLANVIAGRIANRLDLHGTNCTIDAACAGSLAAVHAAVNELVLGQADLMISGGVDTCNNPMTFLGFSKTPALSKTGDIRPFSEAADGTILGEGVGMVALKRLADAERDGDRIHAVIKGIGTSSDGRGTAIYAPAAKGQARALQRTYERAGYGPATVELVEAHGTGTRAGDAAEFAALREVFTPERDDTGWCALGSVKSQIGHTKAAAGAAAMIKMVLALQHKRLPPTIKIDQPNPAMDIAASPFYLNTRTRPWIRSDDHPRRASMTSSGFGGSNFHMALEEYRPGGTGRGAQDIRTMPAELILLSAENLDGLAARGEELQDLGGIELIAAESQRSFDPAAPVRLAVVVEAGQDFAERLALAVTAVSDEDRAGMPLPGGISYQNGPAEPGGVAYLFPGQGAQYPGMGADVAMAFDAAREIWDRAAGLELGEQSLHQVVFPPPVFDEQTEAAQRELLTDTRWTQPALAAHSASLLAVLEAAGVQADVAAGHSLGELVALSAAGVLDTASLLRLARRRGELVHAAADRPGAMLAVMAPIDRVREELARTVAADVWVANHNRPDQVVVSGTVEAVDTVQRAFEAAEISCRRLNVATAFHSPLVAQAARPLLEHLNTLDLGAPGFPVYGNADALTYPGAATEIRERLAAQVASPVLFVDQIEAMYAAGARVFVEVGAGTALTGMASAILGDRPHLAVALDRRGSNGVTTLLSALGALAVRGVPVDTAALWPDGPPTRETAERPAMTLTINGSQFARPHPEPEPAGPAVKETYVMQTPAAEPPIEPAAVRPAPVVPSAGRMSHDVGDPWLQAFVEVQRQTAETHVLFQQTLAASQQDFLTMAENSINRLTGYLDDAPPARPETRRLAAVPVASAPASLSAPATLAPPPIPAPVPAPVAMPVAPPPVVRPAAPEPMVSPQPAAPVRVPSEVAAPAPAAAPKPPAPQPVAAAPVQTVAAPAPEPEAAQPGGLTLDALVVVVSEKTGYPESLIGGDMDLESDLGVDSIKKVEILSTVRQRVPGLPPADSPEMSDLFRARTLNEVVMRVGGGRPGPAAVGMSGREPSAQPEEPEPVRRYRVQTVPAAASGLAMAGLRTGVVRVVDGGSGLAAPIVERLARNGIDAVEATTPASGGGLILLGGMAAVDSPDHGVRLQREALGWARAAAPGLENDGGVFVTVQDTGGSFALAGDPGMRAWVGGLAALARTAAHEWPAASVKAIDCARAGRTDAEVADAIVVELLTGGPTLDVGLHADGTRHAVEVVEAKAEPAPELPGGPAVLVVSGGARGVTAAAVRELAAGRAMKLAILARTELADEPESWAAARTETALIGVLASEGVAASPAAITARARAVLAAREVRTNLRELEQAGAEVRYLPLDVADSTSVVEALTEIRRSWGPITGLVHGAGGLADKRIADKTEEQFDRVFTTKVEGLRVLLDATADDPLDTLCLFSSVAARFGNPGQSDYAMANEVLNHVAAAQQARRPGCRVRSICWGPWDGGMVTPLIAAQFEARGVGLIPLRAGARAFVAELTAADSGTQVVIGSGPEFAGAVRAEISVAGERFAGLTDHSIAGMPVLPVAMAVEWMSGLSLIRSPGSGSVALTDLEVLRKVELPGRDRTLFVESDADGSRLQLMTDGPAPHYRAKAAIVGTAGRWDSPAGLQPLGKPAVYDGRLLFHGPAFQALDGLVEVARAGAAAQVRGAIALGWPAASWTTDPVAVDGALQLTALWAERVLGGATLPMRMDEFRWHRLGPASEPMRCVVQGRHGTDDIAVCDVALLEPDGAVRAELFGVTLVKRPDLA